MSVLCPRCKQGNVEQYIVRVTRETIFVCDECEATWKSDLLWMDSFTQLTVLLEERGLTPLWSELSPVAE